MMKKKIKKIILTCISLFMIFSSGINFVHAKTRASRPVANGNIADAGARLRHTEPNGYWQEAYWMNGLTKVKLDGADVFCVEPNVIGLGGNYYPDENAFSKPLKDKLSLIAYYGWETSSKTNDDYATTQYMMWEALGWNPVEWYGSFGNRYASLKANVQAKINNHSKKPSFNGSSNYEVKLGETLRITDTNGVLSQFHIGNNGGANVRIEGNQLVITPNVNTPDNITIGLQKVAPKFCGTSIIYKSSAGNGQDIGKFMVGDPVFTNVKIKVNKYGSVKLAKQDETGTFIPDTSFKLSYKADMSEVIGEYTTGEDGTITVDQLLPQTVYVQETSVPEPLVLDSTIYSVNVVPNDTVSYTAVNNIQKGQITVIKQDVLTKDEAQGDANLSGAEFDVYNADKTKVVDHLDENRYTTNALPLGNYFVKETKAPTGYNLNEEYIPVELKYSNQTEKVSYTDMIVKDKVIEGKVAITKSVDHPLNKNFILRNIFNALDRGMLIPAKDFVFDITHDTTGKVVDTITTDEDGYAESKLLPYGHYTITERSNKNYATIEPIHVFINKEGKVYRYNIQNEITKVDISKKDITTGKELEGATLKVYPKGNPNEIVNTWTSTKEEHRIQGLEIGRTYVLEETFAPYGFTIANKVEFTIKDTNEIQKVELKNEIEYGQFEFTKRGNQFTYTDLGQNEFGTVHTPVWEEMNIIGAEVTLYADEDITLANGITYYEKDEAIETLVSDLDPVVSKDLPVGKYYYKETKAPTGFVQDTEKHEFEVKHNQTVQVELSNDTLLNERPTYDIEFTKFMEENNTNDSSEAYKDVIFGIYTRDDTYDWKGNVAIEPDTLLATTGIDEEGHLVHTPELPVGNYYLKELQTNTAYELDPNEYDFSIDQSNDSKVTIQINNGKPIVNELKDFQVKVNKVDAQTKKNIKSSHFEFTRYADAKCTKVLEKAYADTKTGTALFDEIHYGVSYIKETKAPTGYVLSEDVVKVEVNEEGVFVNDKKVESEEEVYSIIYQNTLMPTVNTGDTTNTDSWWMLLCASSISILGILLILRRRIKER